MEKWEIINWVWDGEVLESVIIYFTSYEEAKNKFDNYFFMNEVIAIELIERQVYNGAVYERTLAVKKNEALWNSHIKNYLTWI